MYLSHSGRKLADKCTYAYWHVYINSTPHGKPDDRLGSIYGSAVGKLFEQFYVERLWRQPSTLKVMEARIEKVVDDALKEALEPKKGKPGGVIVWRGLDPGQNPNGRYVDRDELIIDVRHAVRRGLQSIKHHLLISSKPEAELKLHSDLEGHRLGGYADFVMRRVEHKDLVIVDGKGSRHRDKYIDESQLWWYAMLYQLKRGVLPDKVGFLYWKYEPPMNLDWFEVTQEKVDAVKESTLMTISKLEGLEKELPGSTKELNVVQEVYAPHATKQNCQFCPYATEDLCSTGFNKIQAKP